MIGLFGGSFDPVHRGHIETLAELQGRLPFTEIRVLPAARSPLKPGPAADQHRQAMLELALAGHPGLVLDTRELRRPPPSYTIDTLRELRAETGPGTPLVFIMGLDSLLDLPRWKDWQQLTRHAHLLIVSRPGTAPVFAPALEAWLKSVRTTGAELLQSSPGGRVLFMDTCPWPVASRDLRLALGQGADLGSSLDPAVLDYIHHHQLYRQHGETTAQ
jgi:nicotinate-nucleotide adenylyltransferase